MTKTFIFLFIADKLEIVVKKCFQKSVISIVARRIKALIIKIKVDIILISLPSPLTTRVPLSDIYVVREDGNSRISLHE